MDLYTPRLVKPEDGNPYYNTTSVGGYSHAIEGFPTDLGCNVLSNCVGYAYGRFNEIGQYGECRYLQPVNANLFIEYKGNLEVGQIPKLGSCMVWDDGDFGHVAIVEQIESETRITTSESTYGSSIPFETHIRYKGDGDWGMGSRFRFLGFIYNPAVTDNTLEDLNPPVATNTQSIYPLEEGIGVVNSVTKRPFLRKLHVYLTNDAGNGFKFGTDDFMAGEPLSIKIECHKYMSLLKDTCLIRIANLPATALMEIMNAKYQNVRIECGHRNTSMITIFSGKTLAITSAIVDAETKTTEAVILAAPAFFVDWNKQKINIQKRGYTNPYALIRDVCKEAGVTNYSIDSRLEQMFPINIKSTEIFNIEGSLVQWLSATVSQYDDLAISTDDTSGKSFSIYPKLNGLSTKITVIDGNVIDLNGGFPQLNSEGLTFSLIPYKNFRCGDVIKIPNTMIQLQNLTDRSQLANAYGMYLDEKEEYIIYEIEYSLTNREKDFSQKLHCKGRNLWNKVLNQNV